MPIKKRLPYMPKNERLHLTAKLIDSLATDKSDYHVKDDELRKLHLKVTPAGNKRFLLRYRNSDGVERKLKLGNYPDMNVAIARRRAGEELLKISQGADPSAAKSANRSEATFEEYSWKFIENHAEVQLRPNTVYGYKGLLKKVVNPAIGNKKLRLVATADLLELRKKLRGTPYLSNRAIGLVRKIFNYAHQAGDLPDDTNPAKGIPQFKENWRERLFSEDEMIRIGQAIALLKKEKPSAIYAYSAIQFLFLTGCRKNEALGMKWADIDTEREFLEFVKTKTDPRTQKLTDELSGLLSRLPSKEFSQWVFPGPDSTKHIVNISKSWAAVLQKARIEHARLHDIRHTILSDIANATDLPTAAAIGGHKTIQSTMRYVHGRTESTNRALRDAAAKTGSFLIVDLD
ncbi:MAG: tyrosine-type recombinase/integrase [Rhodobacteraceae bacterium]|nr:tyrosine-type recombinase/integrase [Paracoccaceae bacterium]